jgi:hypothetical protein
VLALEVCSSDPLACWSTGEVIATDESGAPLGRAPGPGADPMWAVGLEVDAGGQAAGDVPVWRFLPGGEPGTYVDCAVSRCSLRLHGPTAPPTVPLRFRLGGDGPVAPTLAVDPSTGLATGDEVTVRGAGFPGGVRLYIALCAQLANNPVGQFQTCGSMEDDEGERVRGDGTFQVPFVIPDTERWSGEMGQECDDTGQCTDVTYAGGGPLRCDGVDIVCYLTAEAYVDYEAGPSVAPPTFTAPPVKLTMR